MDARTNGASNGFLRVKQSNGENADSMSKLKGKGSLSSKELMFRADQIDLKNLDFQLEQNLNKVYSKPLNTTHLKEESEIDLPKMELKHLVAHGTYGPVYRRTTASSQQPCSTTGEQTLTHLLLDCRCCSALSLSLPLCGSIIGGGDLFFCGFGRVLWVVVVALGGWGKGFGEGTGGGSGGGWGEEDEQTEASKHVNGT